MVPYILNFSCLVHVQESIADGRKKKRPTMMIVIILVVSGVLVLVSFIICFIIKERKQKDNKGKTLQPLSMK